MHEAELTGARAKWDETVSVLAAAGAQTVRAARGAGFSNYGLWQLHVPIFCPDGGFLRAFCIYLITYPQEAK
jgi:hypothetical protein